MTAFFRFLKIPRRPRLALSLLSTVSLATALLMILIGLGMTWQLQWRLETDALQQVAIDAADQVIKALGPILSSTDLAAPMSPAEYARLDASIREKVLSNDPIVRVKIWSRDGTLIYSDEATLIGQRFPLSEHLVAALRGEIAMEISSLTEAENVAERDQFSRLMEVYIPLRANNSTEVIGVFETYYDLATVDFRVSEMRRYVWTSVGLGFLILYAAIFVLVRNASHALARRNEENARLYAEATQQLTQRKQIEAVREALLEIMQGIVTTRDLSSYLKLVHTSIAKVIYAKNIFIILYNKHTDLFEEVYSVDQYDLPGPPARLEKSISAHVFRTGQPLLLTQALFNDLAAQGKVELVGTNSPSWLGVPLRTSEETIGVMVVQDYHNPDRYSERDVDFLVSIAGQVALAVQRRQAEAAMHLQSTALSAAANAMLITDRTGAIEWINPAFTTLTGYTAEEAVGKNPRELIRSGEHSPQFYKDLWDTLLGGTIWRGEIVNRRKNGTRYIEEQSITPMWDERGAISHFIAIKQDVSERKRAAAELQRRADEFTALYETSKALSIENELNRLLQTIVERAGALLNSSASRMYFYDAARAELVAAIATSSLIPLGTRLRLGEGMAGRVAQTRQPLRVDDYARWEGHSSTNANIPFRAVLEVPMLYGGELVGVLTADELGDSERRFTEADERLLTLFAAQAAGAIHSARLLEQTRQRLAELEALHAVSATLRLARTRDEALPLLLDKTLAALETDAGMFWLYDSDTDELRASIARGWFRGLYETAMKPGEGIGGMVFASGRTHLSFDFRNDPTTRNMAREQIPEGRGGACVPIRTGTITVGVLFVSLPPPRQITPEQVKLLESLAEMGGAALHRMNLYDNTVRQLDRLQALRSIDQAITASMELSVTLNVVLEQTRNQLHVDAASILLFDPNQNSLRYAAARGFRTIALQHTHLRQGEGYAGRAVLERKTIHIPDLVRRKTDFLRSPHFATEGFVAYAVVPLFAKGQVVGALEVFHRAPLVTNADWFGFLEMLAGQAAIAIDNATLFDGLQRSNAELAGAYDATIEGWSRAMDLRDHETEGHTLRVTNMAVRLARQAGIREADLVHVHRGGLLHDIGKMGVPDSILLKPDRLTDDEWVIMRRHPQFAYEMLAPISYLHPALDIPYCHHEKFDGTGYPQGLKGEQIPLAARLFAVVDVWDALRSDRPYRRGWPEDKVIAHLKAGSGAHFAPEAVELFIRVRSEEWASAQA